MQVKNFGHNLAIRPAAAYTPASEEEVLQILDAHQGQQIHAVGRLHSWSEAAVGDGVLLDLKKLNQVEVQVDGDSFVAVVGAGCQIKRLLRQLDSQANCTLMSLGLITEQTIAGAISTGTHGSGHHSMSHYVEAVRLARYDPSSGKAIIEDITSGDELLASRCSLGSLGIILAVHIRCRRQYNVQEHFARYSQLSDVLATEASSPIQQFYLLPWHWSFSVQHRREHDGPRSSLAGLYRLYWLLGLDIGLHILILLVARILKIRWLIRLFFRHFVPTLLIRNWKVTDRSSAMLVMKHELFRHIEIELFVQQSQLENALKFSQEVIELAGGRESTLSEDNQQRIEELGLQDSLAELHDQYFHHYPICIRRVVADETLISMASGEGEDWYAVSFISYVNPADRAGFYLFSSFMARSMSRLYGARPHWGKLCPLNADELEALYPRFADFREICNKLDPQGAFRNRWTETLLRAGSASEDPR